jgi:hypothetical protein
MGRWLNRDPHEEAGGINPYAFVFNDPLNRYDKDGRIAPLLLALWLVAEISLQAYDTWILYDTLADPEASVGDKVLTAAGFAASAVLPGGGYGAGARATTRGVTTALDSAAKKQLRGEARKVYQHVSGTTLSSTTQVHHRIPLEWTHLFPDDPNRVPNLVAVDSAVHGRINELWRQFKVGLNGCTPSQTEIFSQARAIDSQFGALMMSAW